MQEDAFKVTGLSVEYCPLKHKYFYYKLKPFIQNLAIHRFTFTRLGLMMPYGNLDLVQHWLK